MNKKYFWTFAALMAVYLTLSLIVPTDPETLRKHDITQQQAHLLLLTIIIPLSAAYFAALYGFLRFRSYASSVADTKEGPALMDISRGLMVLAFGLPIVAILGSILNYIELRHVDLVPTATIIRNYATLLFPFAAFFYIARGSEKLISTLKNKKLLAPPVRGLIWPIVLACLYTWLVTSQTQAATEPVFHMSTWLVILTLIIPYVYIWCVSINAARNLYFYKDHVKGLLYKRAIDYLAKGIAVIILLSIILQVITTLSSFSHLNLAPLLLVIYILVGLYALGYGLVARGAKKLKQIEEV